MKKFRKILNMSTQKNLHEYPKRGNIFIADLNPSFGYEIHKKRPVLIVSHNSFNKKLRTIIILPFSSIVTTFIGPEMIEIPSQKGLDKPSIILLSQIRAIDKSRLIKKIGVLSKEKMLEVEEALKLVLGMIEI